MQLIPLPFYGDKFRRFFQMVAASNLLSIVQNLDSQINYGTKFEFSLGVGL